MNPSGLVEAAKQEGYYGDLCGIGIRAFPLMNQHNQALSVADFLLKEDTLRKYDADSNPSDYLKALKRFMDDWAEKILEENRSRNLTKPQDNIWYELQDRFANLIMSKTPAHYFF